MAPSIDCTSYLYFVPVPDHANWDIHPDEEDAGSLERNVLHVANSEAENPCENAALLSALVAKEKFYMPMADYVERLHCNCFYARDRENAVCWILKVQEHYCFRPETAVLAVSYLDRYLSCTHFQQDKAWVMQLASVACLSLAAKMEETHVPLLLDLQVEGAGYTFDSRTIQRMELLLLGILEWRMSSVTPLSYIDYACDVLGLVQKQHRSTFMMRSRDHVVCALKDMRFLAFRPPTVAAAIMLCVIKEMDVGNAIECENRLQSVLKVKKDMLEGCYQLLQASIVHIFSRKRKSCSSFAEPDSPHGVLDASFSFNTDNLTKSHGSHMNTDSPKFSQSAPEKMRRIGDSEEILEAV
eukprot:Gb_03361 [translate_table: standard]